jgi:hypothetical protein
MVKKLTHDKICMDRGVIALDCRDMAGGQSA